MNFKFSSADLAGHKIHDHNTTMNERTIINNLKTQLERLDHMNEKTEEELLIDQYKLVANSYEAIQQRRIGNNNVFIFIYSVIIGLYNFLSNENVPLADVHLSYSIYGIFLLGMVVGFTWIDVNLGIIKSEKHKYMLLRMFESHMPLKIFTKPADMSKIGKSSDGTEQVLSTRYFDLVLPIFMILGLALNFFFMMFE